LTGGGAVTGGLEQWTTFNGHSYRVLGQTGDGRLWIAVPSGTETREGSYTKMVTPVHWNTVPGPVTEVTGQAWLDDSTTPYTYYIISGTTVYQQSAASLDALVPTAWTVSSMTVAAVQALYNTEVEKTAEIAAPGATELFATDGADVWKSVDNGVTWNWYSSDPGVVTWVEGLAIDPEVEAADVWTSTGVIKSGPAGDYYFTDGTNVFWAANAAGPWTQVDDLSVAAVNLLPATNFTTTYSYYFLNANNVTRTLASGQDGLYWAITPRLPQGNVNAGLGDWAAGNPNNAAGVNNLQPSFNAYTNPGTPEYDGNGNTVGVIEVQAVTNGFTGTASLPSVTLPATVNGNNVTGATVNCEQWNQVGGVWDWRPITNGTTSVALADTRPAWCQNATSTSSGVTRQANYLTRGQALNAGQWLISQNCQFGLTVQASDGNVVLYELNPNFVGGTITNATIVRALAATEQFYSEFAGRPSTLFFGNDGNVVQYMGGLPSAGSASNAVAWTGTQNTGAFALYVQDDGNVVIYAGGTPSSPQNPVWARAGLNPSNGGGQVESTINNSPLHFFAVNN
jgi:hypothetical protein